MSRLTRKFETPNGRIGYQFCVGYDSGGTPIMNMNCAIHKLGKLEDLEEELGCPLEVLVKALKDGVKVNMEFLDIDITDDILRPKLYYSDDFQCYGLSIQSWGYFVRLKDYKKTWWLRGETDD